MDISFIIVNYNSDKFLNACIASINFYASGFLYEIIIVNNNTFPLKAFAENGHIKIVENHINLGFAKACNIGAKNAIGEKLFFINPDTEIQTPIHKLMRALDNQAIGIAAPQLITTTDDVEPWSFGDEITLLGVLANNFRSHKKLSPLNIATHVDWVSGAALVISKNFFTLCGGFDENFFMYFEDTDLCKRARLLGKSLVIVPKVKVLHYNGKSFNDKKQQKKQYYLSQDYYFKKHFRIFSVYLLKILRFFSLILKH